MCALRYCVGVVESGLAVIFVKRINRKREQVTFLIVWSSVLVQVLVLSPGIEVALETKESLSLVSVLRVCDRHQRENVVEEWGH